MRVEASAGRMVDFWTNPDELRMQVTTALAIARDESPRPGWVRDPQTNPEILEELARLSRRNAELEQYIASEKATFPELKTELLGGQMYFVHDGENEGDLNFTIRVENIGKVKIERVGISLEIKSNIAKKHLQIKNQSHFRDLAPGEYLDILIPNKSLNLDRFPEEVVLSYVITGLNISNPIREEIICPVLFDEHSYWND